MKDQERPRGWFLKKATVIVINEETTYLNELVDSGEIFAVNREVQRLDPRGKMDEEEELVKKLDHEEDDDDYIFRA